LLTFLLYQTENGLRKNCGSPHEVRAQKRHTYFVRVSAIFANQFCLGITANSLKLTAFFVSFPVFFIKQLFNRSVTKKLLVQLPG